ncbi:MAG: hypothetical protein HZA78_08080 [Candidatus Schekmanbacteria bacterium]|nr:hypothetical protein [Candidatus Schekmanbacteria bacterium]
MRKQTFAEEIDVSSFIGDIAHQLVKEGDGLRALADTWFDDGTDEKSNCVEIGVELARLGRHLLALRENLCNSCLTLTVAETIKFGEAPAKEKEPGGKEAIQK